MFVHTILFTAFAIESEESANGHPGLIILMKEATGVTLHTKAAEPMAANRLPEAPPAPDVASCGASSFNCSSRTNGAGGGVGDGGGGGRGRRVGLDEGQRGGGGVGGAGIEAALEIEAENALRILHE